MDAMPYLHAGASVGVDKRGEIKHFMANLRDETKEQLLARLDRIYGLIAGSIGATVHDTENINAVRELASGESDAEFLVRFQLRLLGETGH